MYWYSAATISSAKSWVSGCLPCEEFLVVCIRFGGKLGGCACRRRRLQDVFGHLATGFQAGLAVNLPSFKSSAPFCGLMLGRERPIPLPHDLLGYFLMVDDVSGKLSIFRRHGSVGRALC